MAADAETVEMYAGPGGFGSIGRLVAEAQTPLRTVELDVLNEDNAALSWGRDSGYDSSEKRTVEQECVSTVSTRCSTDLEQQYTSACSLTILFFNKFHNNCS